MFIIWVLRVFFVKYGIDRGLLCLIVIFIIVDGVFIDVFLMIIRYIVVVIFMWGWLFVGLKEIDLILWDLSIWIFFLFWWLLLLYFLDFFIMWLINVNILCFEEFFEKFFFFYLVLLYIWGEDEVIFWDM